MFQFVINKFRTSFLTFVMFLDDEDCKFFDSSSWDNHNTLHAILIVIFNWIMHCRSEKPLLERRESIEEAEERRRQLTARLSLGLEPGKRKPEEIPLTPAEAYVVTPHRKRRPGFHNSPAQNPAFVPFNPGFETPRRLTAPHPLSVSAPPYLVSVCAFINYN